MDWKEASVSLSLPEVYVRFVPEKVIVTGPTLYSQNDPRWKDEVYAGGATFAQAGCYVTCVAMVAAMAGHLEEPPEVAMRLREAGCFTGNLLTNPERIPVAYPLLEYGGSYVWHTTPAKMDVVWKALREGPCIGEVDFRPTTAEFNQHFVVFESHDEETGDIWILDPWDGKRVRLLERYGLVWYAKGDEMKLEHAICGLRVLRPK